MKHSRSPLISRLILPSLVLFLALPRLHAQGGNADIHSIALEMADGQSGTLVPEDEAKKEEDPGVFTVANKNDTDGDGIPDATDNDVTGGDIDLMEMKVHRFLPYNAQDDGEKMVTLEVPENAKVYKSKDKKSGLESPLSWKAKDLDDPKQLWVEIQEASSSVRAEVFKLTGGGVSDTVKTTGIWVVLDGVRNKNTDVMWADLPAGPMKTLFESSAGYDKSLGKTIKDNVGVSWAITFRFKLLPTQIGKETKVKFDISRQKNHSKWAGFDNNVWQRTANVPFLDIDKVNDEAPANDQGDNNNIPTTEDMIHSMDGPGTPPDDAQFPYLTRQINFNEFVRVGFGTSPSGSENGGSRISKKEPWRAFMSLKRNLDAKYEERNGKTNEVELGHKTISTAENEDPEP